MLKCWLVAKESVVVLVVKQKTAYEMRISDWSADVCSSDLQGRALRCGRDAALRHRLGRRRLGARPRGRAARDADRSRPALPHADHLAGVGGEIGRASCRARVCQYV